MSDSSVEFEVWFCVSFLGHETKRHPGEFAEGLWVKLSVPAILPIGSSVFLPTPLGWERTGGELYGIVRQWRAFGDALVCEVVERVDLDQDSLNDLLAIGYVDCDGGYPDEVIRAGDKLLR